MKNVLHVFATKKEATNASRYFWEFITDLPEEYEVSFAGRTVIDIISDTRHMFSTIMTMEDDIKTNEVSYLDGILLRGIQRIETYPR